MFKTLGLAVALVFSLPIAGHGALVGTLSVENPVITTPIAFNAKADVFNSFTDIPGGLSFAIAPGASAPVKLEVLRDSGNVRVVAAALDSAFGISQTLPLSITTPAALAAGLHNFAIGAVVNGSQAGALVARLSLTPLPGALLLLGPAVVGLAGWNWARRRGELPEASRAV